MATAEAQGRNVRDLVPSGQLVTFTLDGVEFGLDIERVQEITPRTDITPVPGAPSFVMGVLNLRGSIIPVLDSRAPAPAGRKVASARASARDVSELGRRARKPVSSKTEAR